VTIQSQPGEGTAVTLYLPRAAAESAGPALRGGASPASTASGEVILVVEDQEPVREVTMKRLARLGYQTREADSAVAAIELLRSGEKVDLIFSDVVMPGGLTGFDLAEWVGINHPGLPVLLTSGFSESIAQGLTGERGAFAVLRKPYSGEDLAAAIRAALDQARATSGVKT
jgi:CheY-like chemotaxis protein